ncbi:hypothetical protein [Amycolatopsis sp. NPDC054798]
MWQFWLLLAVTAVLAVREILHATLGRTAGMDWLLRPELLGVGPSVSLLVGALTLLLVRNQFALGLRPFISYHSGWLKSNSGTVYLAEAEGPIWAVTARNAGSGIGVIRNVRITVACADSSTFSGTHDETVAFLRERCDLEQNREYALSKLSPGGVFASGDEIRLFELTHGSRCLFSEFTVSVEFEGTLRDAYAKNIFCIPPSGIPPAPQKQREE